MLNSFIFLASGGKDFVGEKIKERKEAPALARSLRNKAERKMTSWGAIQFWWSQLQDVNNQVGYHCL
jgi:hypothetical protein